MKIWIKSVVLGISLTVYIMLGSLAFLRIEGGNERMVGEEIGRTVRYFIGNHSECGVNGDAMRDLLEAVDTALTHSIADLSSVDRDAPLKDIWSMGNAFVLCFTMVTTMGFGWIAPKSLGGRIFCIVFAVPGITLSGYTLKVIGSTCQVIWLKGMKLFVKCVASIKSQRVHNVLGVLATTTFLWLFAIMLPAVVFTQTENWSLLVAQYFNFVSLSTIGFGDIAPSHAALAPEDRNIVSYVLYRLGVMLYFFVGMAVISVVFTGVWRYQKRRVKEAMDSTRLMMITRGWIQAASDRNTNDASTSDNLDATQERTIGSSSQGKNQDGVREIPDATCRTQNGGRDKEIRVELVQLSVASFSEHECLDQM